MSGKRKKSAGAGRSSERTPPVATGQAEAVAARPASGAPRPPAARPSRPAPARGLRNRKLLAVLLGGLVLVGVLAGVWAVTSGGSRGKLATKSISELQQLAVRSPNDPEVLFQYGTALMKQGAANDAAGIFQRVVQIEPNRLSAHLSLGQCLSQVGDLGGAETAFRKAIEIDPRGVDAYHGLIRLYQENGETQSAIEAQQAVLKNRPADAAGWYALGYLHGTLQQQGPAAKALERATALVPNHPLGWRALGRVYWHMNRLDEAERALQRALQLQPQDPHALLWLAQVYLKRPDSPANRARAGEALQKATAPGQRPLPDAHLELARIYLRNGQPLVAEQSLRSVLRLDPNHEAAHLELGRLLAQGAKREEGEKLLARHREMTARRQQLKALESRAEKDGAAPETLLQLARLHRGYGNIPQAMRAYRKYLSVRTQDRTVADEMIAYRKEVLPQLAQPASSPSSLDEHAGHDHADHDHAGHDH